MFRGSGVHRRGFTPLAEKLGRIVGLVLGAQHFKQDALHHMFFIFKVMMMQC